MSYADDAAVAVAEGRKFAPLHEKRTRAVQYGTARKPLVSADSAECRGGVLDSQAATDKAKLVFVTDPATVRAVERNGIADPIGQPVAGGAWVYAWSLERWRKRPTEKSGAQ